MTSKASITVPRGLYNLTRTQGRRIYLSNPREGILNLLSPIIDTSQKTSGQIHRIPDGNIAVHSEDCYLAFCAPALSENSSNLVVVLRFYPDTVLAHPRALSSSLPTIPSVDRPRHPLSSPSLLVYPSYITFTS